MYKASGGGSRKLARRGPPSLVGSGGMPPRIFWDLRPSETDSRPLQYIFYGLALPISPLFHGSLFDRSLISKGRYARTSIFVV